MKGSDIYINDDGSVEEVNNFEKEAEELLKAKYFEF